MCGFLGFFIRISKGRYSGVVFFFSGVPHQALEKGVTALFIDVRISKVLSFFEHVVTSVYLFCPACIGESMSTLGSMF